MFRGFFLLLLLLPLTSFAVVLKGVDDVLVPIAQPKRVVVLNRSNAEIMIALKQTEKIVAADVSSVALPELKSVTSTGHPYRPSAEGIISLKPDLVLASEESLPVATAEQLRSAKIAVLRIENSGKGDLEGLLRRIDFIAQAMGVEKEGNILKEKTKKDFARIEEKIKTINVKPKIFFLYAHGNGDAFIYGKETGSDYLIRLAGGTNAADFTTGTKPLTAEAMVQASPDALILLGRGLKAAGGVEGVLKMPGVALSKAGKEKRIIEVDDSIRWIGLRFPEYAEKLITDLGNN